MKNEKVKLIVLNKSQWNNVAERIDNLDGAKHFLKTHTYNWMTKKGALNNFKHTIMKAKKRKLALNEKSTIESNNPEFYVAWLKEITVDDLVDKVEKRKIK